MNPVFGRVNLRHLTRHRLRTVLTVSGIAAGVALVFSISVINATLLSSFRSSARELAGNAEIEVSAVGQSGLAAAAVEEVAATEGVDRAVPVLRSTSRLVADGRDERVLVLGVTPEITTLFPRGLGALGNVSISGGFGGSGRGLLLAGSVARALALEVGERIRVETPRGLMELPVSGRISGGALVAINGGDVAIMLLPAAQEVFERDRRVDSIYVVADPSFSVAEVEDALAAKLGGTANVAPPGERSSALERVFEGLGILLSLAGTVALFVALFVVYNTMSMSTAERRREISMALALGATRRQIFAAFLFEAAVLGIAASLLGVLTGLGLATVLAEQAVEGYRILPVSGAGPIVVTTTHVAVAIVSGIAVALIGAFVPARRVLRVSAVESLRPDAAYEWQRGDAAGRGRRTVLVGIAALAVGAVLFLSLGLNPEQRWIPTAGLVAGLTGITLLLPHIVPPAARLLRPVMTKLFGTVGRLASDALLKNPGRTTFTVAALVLTLGVAIGVGSALASYQAQVEATASSVIGAPVYVAARSYTGLSSDQPLPIEVRDDIAAVPGVKFVYTVRAAFVDVGDGQGVLFAVPIAELLDAGANSDLAALTSDPEGFVKGLERGGIAISRTAATRRDLAAGDEITLPTPSGRHTFQVAAIFDDLVEFDSFYVDTASYRELWDDDKADQFGVLLQDDASLGRVKDDLRKLVARKGLSARVLTEAQLLGRILDIVEGTFSLGRGIQLAALVVAALTIANTMFTAVFERRWEMGLEQAIGMSRAQLARSVLLEAAAIGLLGGAGGALLGTAAGFLMTQAMEAQFSWRIAFVPPVDLVLLAVLGGVVIAAFAGLLPSRLAVRVPIIENLRYE